MSPKNKFGISLGVKSLLLTNYFFLISRKHGKGSLETDGDGAIIQIWRTEGCGNRSDDGNGLQHRKQREEEAAGESEKG